jgi:hypothetical protein
LLKTKNKEKILKKKKKEKILTAARENHIVHTRNNLSCCWLLVRHWRPKDSRIMPPKYLKRNSQTFSDK